MTRSAAVAQSSCSHTRTTLHPASRKRRSVSASLATFAASFSSHHAAFVFGRVPWMGQQCQKQPSTKTATRRREKTRSALRRIPGTGAVSTRNRRPRRCRLTAQRQLGRSVSTRGSLACVVGRSPTTLMAEATPARSGGVAPVKAV